MIRGTKEPTVSVVIPARNVESWIGPTIESVLAQDEPPLEIVVIDDGSEDRTPDIARGFGSAVAVFSQANRGLSAARNAGAARAAGDIIFFLDADDVLLPGTIDHALATWKKRAPDAAVCIPNHIRSFGQTRSLAWPAEPEARTFTRPDLPALLRRNFLLSNALIVKDVWSQFPFDERLRAVEDLDLYARLLLADIPILSLGRPGIVMAVQRDGSLTSDTRLMRAQRRKVFKQLSGQSNLRGRERAILAWQRIRTAVGERVAKSAGDHGVEGEAFRVLHVLLDQPGGGPQHVSLLTRHLEGIRSEVYQWSTGGPLLKPLSWGWNAAALRRKSRSMNPDIVHAHGVRVAGSSLVALAGSRALRRVVTIHGLHSIRRSHGMTLRAAIWFNRITLSRFDRVIVLGPSDEREVSARRLAERANVRSIAPAIEIETPSERSHGLSPPRVLWMGRFVEQKDPLAYVRLSAELSALDAVWLMAGDGPLHDRTKDLAAELSAPIEFLGWQEQPRAILSSSDIFVSTSRWEGLPLTLLEAAASGLAIVATDVAGNVDIAARGLSVKLVKPGDDKELGTAVRSLITDDRKRLEVAQQTLEAAQASFDIGRMARETRVVYEELLRNGDDC